MESSFNQNNNNSQYCYNDYSYGFSTTIQESFNFNSYNSYNYFSNYSPASNSYVYSPTQQQQQISSTPYSYYSNNSYSTSSSPFCSSSSSNSPSNTQYNNMYSRYQPRQDIFHTNSPDTSHLSFNCQFTNSFDESSIEQKEDQLEVKVKTPAKRKRDSSETITHSKRPKVLKLDLTTANIGFGTASSTTTLTSEITTDLIANTFTCAICEQAFSTAAKLFMHQHKYHKNGSSTQCPICLKKFNSQANALVHVRAHTQEKTYKCKFCSQAFYDSSTLKKHLRTHTGEKPYECKICSKRFTQSGNLKRHLAVHEKYDPIQGVAQNQTSDEQLLTNIKLEFSEFESDLKTSQPINEHPITYYQSNYYNY